MQIKTILNRLQKFKSFVYGSIRLVGTDEQPLLEVDIHERRNSQAVCSGCDRQAAGYDRLPRRRFEYVPLWGIRVFLLYAPRRVSCKSCGIKVEKMPWSVGKHRLTQTYAWHLAAWAKRLSWKETAEVFHLSWHHVFRSVEMAVEWGLAHRSLEQIESIDVDEIAWQKRHKYLTLVYQIDRGRKRLLWIGENRKEETLHRFFDLLGEEKSGRLQFICSDMWRAYLNVIEKRASQAVHVLDRFHIVAHINKAIDKVRAEEARQMRQDGFEPVLKNSRWLLLRHKENLSEAQELKLSELLQYNLKSVKSYLLKEDFHRFWEYKSGAWAGKYLDSWCRQVMRSRIEPMKQVAKMLRRHKPKILNWFKAEGKLSSGVVEGFNTKAKLTIRKAYGFKSYKCAEIALYHTLGVLPTPKGAHKFF